MRLAIRLALIVSVGAALFAALAWDWSATEKTTLSIDVSKVPESQRPIVQQAAQTLFDQCDGLRKYSDDIVSVKAKTIINSALSGDQTRDDRWTAIVSFEVKIADDAKRIPKEWRAGGHHLYYDVGGPKNPGINVAKATGGWFCGIGHNQGFIHDWNVADAAVPIDVAMNRLPYAAAEIHIDKSRIDYYAKLASSIGFDYDRIYGYRDFADTKRKRQIGAAGQYEFLLLSTGGNSNNAEDDMRAMKVPMRWEMDYYRNIDMTIIYAVKIENDRSFVKLLKLERGRVPDLHLR